jgi:GWxTD domain-containing protein
MYTVVFSASDVNNEKRTLTQTSKLTVRAKQNAPEMSDIMFVMPKSESLASQFVRAGQSCEPNPRHEVTGVQPVLGMYMEFYNIKQSQVKSSYAEIAIFNHVLEEELTTYRQIMPTSDLLALRDEIQLENLKTGVYSLRVRLLSEDKSAVYDSREERFYLINPEQLPEQQRLITEDEDFQASQWSVLAGDRLKLELDLSQVLATKTEIETLKLCSDERSKQRYLYRFWKQRDPDDATPANERLDQFRKMYDKAQSMYSSITYKEGWRSDRGTVLLRYGQPTRIKQYFRTDEARPYEKWWYQNIQGGACFYFVDVNEQQDHRLVHSTMNGWVFQPDWYRLFASYKTVTGSDIRSVREILPDNSTAGIGGSRQRLGGIQEDPNDQFPDCENVTSR